MTSPGGSIQAQQKIDIIMTLGTEVDPLKCSLLTSIHPYSWTFTGLVGTAKYLFSSLYCHMLQITVFVFKIIHWYSRKVRNKNRTKNSEGKSVRKYHYEHDTVNASLVVDQFKENVFPHCLTHGYKMIILDNDSKFHTKSLVDAAAEEGIQIYLGSGKRCWVLSRWHWVFFML